MITIIIFLCNSTRSVSEINTVVKKNENIIILLDDSRIGPEFIIPKIRTIAPKAIIALPLSGNNISPLINVPIVLLDPGGLDFLEAFFSAKKVDSNEINYIGFGHPSLLEDLDNFEEILDTRINIFTYQNDEEKETVLKQILGNSIKCAVVTSDLTKDIIEKNGGQAIVVKRGRHAILQALRTAWQVIRSKEEETQNNEWLKSLLDNIHDGVIGTDSYGKITVLNKKAGITLGLSPEVVLGKDLNKLSDEHPIKKLISQGPKELGMNKSKICKYKEKVFLANESIINNNQILITFKDESEIARLQAALHQEAISRGMVARYRFEDIVGCSKEILTTIKTAKKYAQSNTTILIIGETGVGKEVFVQSIHNNSERRNGPFVAINCATIPESILESELFGYEGGSFTGAKKEGKKGLFELANGGTIFLDEIGEMPVTIQARLLRVLQNKEIMHLGGSNVIPIDVRVIAATNRDLVQAVKEKSFRQDLYYRISILNLSILPLRERTEDIIELVKHFLKEKEIEHKKVIGEIDKVLMQRITEYDWPGNVRQLQNFIEKYVYLYEENDDVLYSQIISELTNDSYQKHSTEIDITKQLIISVNTLEGMQKEIITRLLNKYSVSDLSDVLDISRSTIWRKTKS